MIAVAKLEKMTVFEKQVRKIISVRLVLNVNRKTFKYQIDLYETVFVILVLQVDILSNFRFVKL